MLEIYINTTARTNAIEAILIINPKPYSIISNAPTSGPVARPTLEIKPASAAICPCESNEAHNPNIYGITNA